MARPRKDLGPEADVKIIALMARGGTAESIAASLGVSKTTAFRRMQELKSGAVMLGRQRRAVAAAEPSPPTELPPSEDDIPEGTPLEQIDEWLALAKNEVAGAQSPDEVAKMVRLAAALLTLKHKATPLPKPDPNENPDFVEAAARVRKRWHDRLDAIAREVKP